MTKEELSMKHDLRRDSCDIREDVAAQCDMSTGGAKGDRSGTGA